MAVALPAPQCMVEAVQPRSGGRHMAWQTGCWLLGVAEDAMSHIAEGEAAAILPAKWVRPVAPVEGQVACPVPSLPAAQPL